MNKDHQVSLAARATQERQVSLDRMEYQVGRVRRDLWGRLVQLATLAWTVRQEAQAYPEILV